METMNSGSDKSPEEREHDDDIEQEDEEILRTQFGHLPGRLLNDWAGKSEKTFDKEISLDHATEAEWQRFLASLDEEE
jgi:hypothetical protein